MKKEIIVALLGSVLLFSPTIAQDNNQESPETIAAKVNAIEKAEKEEAAKIKALETKVATLQAEVNRLQDLLKTRSVSPEVTQTPNKAVVSLTNSTITLKEIADKWKVLYATGEDAPGSAGAALRSSHKEAFNNWKLGKELVINTTVVMAPQINDDDSVDIVCAGKDFSSNHPWVHIRTDVPVAKVSLFPIGTPITLHVIIGPGQRITINDFPAVVREITVSSPANCERTTGK